jgi:DNA-directed RNA polymerase specialized sigma24 family protein
MFDADPERAAPMYERLRGRTIQLLRWWGAGDPEGLADETFDRVARKLEEGTAIHPGATAAFVRGVARMIFLEAQRRPRLRSHEVRFLTPDPGGEPATLACLDSCLGSLLPPDRDLVLRYYGDGKAADVRRTLARDLGMTATALRIRAHRTRAGLERCVLACLGTETLSPDSSS